LVSILRDTDNRDSELKAEIPISAEHFKKIMVLIDDSKISSRVAKDLLVLTIQEKRDPEELAKEKGLLITTAAGDIEKVVENIISKSASVVEDYKKGKEAALQFLIGQGMKELRGAVDPMTLKKILLEKITKIGKIS